MYLTFLTKFIMSKTANATKAARPAKPTFSQHTVPPPVVTGIPGLDDILVDGLKGLYWAENHLVVTIPKIQEAAKNAALRKALGDHLKVTKGHVDRLEKAFELLGYKPLAKKCDAMEGLAMEGEGVINCTAVGTIARDRGLIMACQKVENYEMTAYKGLILLASQLGKKDIATLLNQTLEEEIEAEELLTTLAENQK
jgi:ferritin-like metal-binding protein YciE